MSDHAILHRACHGVLFYHPPIRDCEGVSAHGSKSRDGQPVHAGDWLWEGFPICPHCRKKLDDWHDLMNQCDAQ